MSRIKPYAGLSLDRLVADLLKENDLHLQYGTDFTLSAPEAHAPGSDGRNTYVVFTPTFWDGAFSPQTLSYTRLPIDVVSKLPEGSILPVHIAKFPVTAKSLLSAINEGLGLDLISDEIVDQTYNVGDFEFRLSIDESVSHAWVGSYVFDVSVDGRQHLKMAIVDASMAANLPFPPSYVEPQEYSASGELLKLINLVNPTTANLLSTDVSFGNVVDVNPDVNQYINTKVLVSATDSSAYYGAVAVYYRRYSLSDLGTGFSLLSESPITEEVVVDYLNTYYNAHLSVADVESISLPALSPGDTGTLTVVTSNKSLAWNGTLDIPYLYGLPLEVDKLHILVNHTLPSPGYLT